MSPADFYLVLAFGFVSSLHCVQMCGPLVLTYSVASESEAGKAFLLGLHLAYNAGRPSPTCCLVQQPALLAAACASWASLPASKEPPPLSPASSCSAPDSRSSACLRQCSRAGADSPCPAACFAPPAVSSPRPPRQAN